jgi:hypothetical protein
MEHEVVRTTIPTIMLKMKSFMLVDPKLHKVILDLIEEMPAFKDFIKPFIPRRRYRLIGHTMGHQFKFSMQNGEPII